jgi:uncharacterized protein
LSLKILLLSDIVVSYIYSPQVRQRFKDVDLIIGCGDLAYYYLEYVMSILDVPCFFIRGNHDKIVEYSLEAQRTGPNGALDLHKRIERYRDLLFAGIEGSQRYRHGPFQYSQVQMWEHVLKLVPSLFANKMKFGRFLDVFVTHAPPAGIHDMPDLPHQGIKAFHWLDRVFRPAYHFHGHIHLYRPDTQFTTRFNQTLIINAYSYREVVIENSNDHLKETLERTEIRNG